MDVVVNSNIHAFDNIVQEWAKVYSQALFLEADWMRLSNDTWVLLVANLRSITSMEDLTFILARFLYFIATKQNQINIT